MLCALCFMHYVVCVCVKVFDPPPTTLIPTFKANEHLHDIKKSPNYAKRKEQNSPRMDGFFYTHRFLLLFI